MPAPKKCPNCRRTMSRCGETVTGRAVWSCPRCLTIKVEGVKLLPRPNTPRLVDPPEPRRVRGR